MWPLCRNNSLHTSSFHRTPQQQLPSGWEWKTTRSFSNYIHISLEHLIWLGMSLGWRLGSDLRTFSKDSKAENHSQNCNPFSKYEFIRVDYIVRESVSHTDQDQDQEPFARANKRLTVKHDVGQLFLNPNLCWSYLTWLFRHWCFLNQFGIIWSLADLTENVLWSFWPHGGPMT